MPPSAAKSNDRPEPLCAIRGEPVAEIDLHLALQRFHERVGQRAAPPADSLRFIAVAKDLESVARIGLEERNQIERRLLPELPAILDQVSHPQHLDHPFLNAFSGFREIRREADPVEFLRLGREVFVVVVKVRAVCREFLCERFEERNQFLVGVMFPAKEIEIDARVAAFELLDFHPKLMGQRDQVGMAGIDQFAAELAEHSVLVEVGFREHTAAGPLASLENFARNSGLQEAIGSGEPGHARAQDRNRLASICSQRWGLGGAQERGSQPASRGPKPRRAQQPHEIAARNARSLPRLEKQFAMIRVLIDPMRLPHGLRQLSKKGRASGWQDRDNCSRFSFRTSRLLRFDWSEIRSPPDSKKIFLSAADLRNSRSLPHRR